MTVAVVPLNVTASWLGIELNPVPTMVTESPAKPSEGSNPTMYTSEDGFTAVESRLPAASYL